MVLKKLILCSALFFGVQSGFTSDIPTYSLEQMPPMTHPVSTSNPNAQESFNIGLSYIFAYNHDLAFREFEKASRLDPNLGMAYWGMALALGQNINSDVTPEREKRAYEYS